jgi:hypothetical protein
VFVRTRVDANLWALPLDSSGEDLTGPPQPLTSSPARKGQESAAGSKLLYSAENGDRFSLVLKDGEKEKVLREGFYSVLSPNGASYVYGEGTKDRLNVRMKSIGWWPFWSTALCETCGMPSGLSPDGKKLLLWDDSPPISHLDMLDFDDAPSEPDRVGRGRSLPARGFRRTAAGSASSRRWGSISGRRSLRRSGRRSYSARGDLLYILTARGGSGNLRWLEALRLDPLTKRPIGGAIPLYEFDDLLVPGMDPIWNTVSVADNRIILELGGMSANIWIK